MKPESSARWSGAFWFVPLAFVLFVAVALSDRPFERGYAEFEYAAASRGIYLVGPFVAAWIALRLSPASRFLQAQRGVRSQAASLFALTWTLLAGVCIAAPVGIVAATRTLPRSGMQWAILMTIVLTVLGCAAFGGLCSRALPGVVAVPVAAAATYMWLALPATGGNVLLRNMNGSFVGCCSSQTQPARALLLASSALASAMAVGFVLALRSRKLTVARRPTWLMVAATVIIAAAALGRTVAVVTPGDLHLLATDRRSTALRCDAVRHVKLCLWPEHVVLRQRVRDVAEPAFTELKALGLAAPSEISESDASDHAVTLRLASVSTIPNIRFSLSQGVVEASSECKHHAATLASFDAASIALALLLGSSADEVAAQVPWAKVAVGRFAALPEPEQLASLERSVAALRAECPEGP